MATGTTDVPLTWGTQSQKKFDSEEEPEWWTKELGTWVKDQRVCRKAFEKRAEDRTENEKKNATKITERRIELLDRIDFDWAPQAKKKRKTNGH